MESIPAPESDDRYNKLVSELRTLHGQIRAKDYNEASELVTIADDLGSLRLGANLLFSYINRYIDVLSKLQVEVAEKRQKEYTDQLELGKAPSSSETHSRNVTRIDEARAKSVEHYIQRIRNEYERYNGICMYLQSRLKESNVERMMG